MEILLFKIRIGGINTRAGGALDAWLSTIKFYKARALAEAAC